MLAEGLNLQQCRHVINYDLPWNPMRLVQRNGRVDRIGSTWDEVFAHCFFPDEQLNRLLDLEERIKHKLAQAAASVGLEAAPIPGGAVGEQVFTESREEIQRLLREDPTLLEQAGEDMSAYSGEEYRKELSRGLKHRKRSIISLPWGAGSGYVGEGKRRGWAFCAKVGDRVFLRFVPADGGEPESDTLTCLKQFTCAEETARCLPDDLAQGAYNAWRVAQRSIHEAWMRATDPINLDPQVPRLFRDMADHIRRHPPSGMSTAEVDDLIERLEAPWPRKICRIFRELFAPDAQRANPGELSHRIAAKVKELGLQPYRRPEPLPPIDEDQMHLVCWMAVEEPAPS